VSSSLSDLDPSFAPIASWFVDYVRQAGYQVTVTSTRRTRKRQQELYDDYLAGQHALPVLPPGSSLHERGLAFDMVINGDYRKRAQADVGREWKRMGGAWGPGDPVHFQPPREWLEEVD
jgi:hypothetical protein